MNKAVRVVLVLMMVVLMIPSAAFAETENAEYLLDVLEQSLDIYAKEAEAIKMVSVGNGNEYCRQVYELEDGNQLVMEFEDGVDGLLTYMSTGLNSAIQPMATDGETVWKYYGYRYFTAKATVITDAGSISLSLANHYTLSEDGIDERYGTADCSISGGGSIGGTVEVKGVYITDSSARTVGSSDVDMYAAYNVMAVSGGIGTTTRTVKLFTTIEYVDHDYDTERIKVKQSWTTG